MRVAVVPGPGRSGLVCQLEEDGSPAGNPVETHDLAAAIREGEQHGEPRWVWPSTASVYPVLMRRGIHVARCHDIALTNALIRGRDAALSGDEAELNQGDAPSLLAAAAADGRLDASSTGHGARADQPALFDPALAGAPEPADPRDTMNALIDVHAGQLRRIAADEHPGRFGLLVAAESAGGTVAAEMSRAGVPWRPDVHDALLTELLGPRPTLAGQRPARLAELAAQVAAAFSGPGAPGGRPPEGTRRPVNPDSPAQVLQAFAAEGIRLPSTRLAVLRDVDHQAVAPLLEYKELARLHSAFGWTWLETWVRGGRFRPE